MSSPPRISIVIPNYNSGPVLERALRSLFEQDDPNLQLIMADAGSTDASRDVIERHRDAFDVLIAEPDNGQADGLNRGFRHADGSLWGWLCADDELTPGALAHARERFAADPDLDVLTGSCERIFPDGRSWVQPVSSDPWGLIGVQNVIEQPTTLWKADLHRRLGELDMTYYLGFDWDLWGRMRDAGAKVETTERVQARYHFSEDNKSGSAGDLFATEAYRLVRTYAPHGRWVAGLFRFVYRRFDLRGCLDDPPTATAPRQLLYRVFTAFARTFGARRALELYNWHFASLQQRGLQWW